MVELGGGGSGETVADDGSYGALGILGQKAGEPRNVEGTKERPELLRSGKTKEGELDGVDLPLEVVLILGDMVEEDDEEVVEEGMTKLGRGLEVAMPLNPALQ